MKFQFLAPTKIIMGTDCIRENAVVLADMGKKALIVTGARSAKANGSLTDVTAALTGNGQEYAVYDKVMSNPTIPCAYDGAALAKEQGVDFVIAIGGGSPMDAAKAIAILARQDIPEEKLFSGGYSPDVLPIACIPTTAGTGSEVTQYSILSNDKAQTKSGLGSPFIFPRYAFLDAKYMMGLPRTTTINTAIDALSHSVEGMLSARAGALTDTLALDSIRGIAACFDAMQRDSLSLEQRESLLYASMLGGMVIANTGTTAVHAMGYSLTYFKNIDHGRANGLLLPSFLRYVEDRIPERIASILTAMGLDSMDGFKAALDALLGEPESLTSEEVDRFSAMAAQTKNMDNCLARPDPKDLPALYRESFGI